MIVPTDTPDADAEPGVRPQKPTVRIPPDFIHSIVNGVAKERQLERANSKPRD